MKNQFQKKNERYHLDNLSLSSLTELVKEKLGEKNESALRISERQKRYGTAQVQERKEKRMSPV